MSGKTPFLNNRTRVIANIAEPQKGKTTYTLSETETCLEYSNINLVFEYNIVVQDVLEKAKQYDFTCAGITNSLLQQYRKEMLQGLVPAIPDMMVGIMDTYRASYLEGYLVWAQETGLPVRTILDEYGTYEVGFTQFYKSKGKYIARDKWIELAIKNEWFEILEVNDATNVNGIISDMIFDEVNIMPGYEGYCGWDSLQVQDLSEEDFQSMLEGDISPSIRRKLGRAWDAHENILINLSDDTDDHSKLVNALQSTEYADSAKDINYKSENTLSDIRGTNTCIVGGKSFGRSVTIPNLTTMCYYRKTMPAVANLLQAAGRVLGKRRFDPLLITTPSLRKALEQGVILEKAIADQEMHLEKPELRHRWLKEQIKDLGEMKLFTSKSNGWTEKSQSYEVTNDIDGLLKADRYHPVYMGEELWNDWENKEKSRNLGKQFNAVCESHLPFLKDIEGVKDRNDNSARRWVAIKHHQGHHKRYVHSKANYREYPYMIGRHPDKPGWGYCIEKLQDHGDKTYHHNEKGETVRLVSKTIERN
jgi:hypothetical protein